MSRFPSLHQYPCRWTNNKPIKGNNQSLTSDNQPKIHRKSSMQYYNIQPYNVQNQNAANKSSSYPNFGSNQATSGLLGFQGTPSREKLNQFPMMQQHHQQFNQQLPAQGQQPSPYHRLSLNNLMPFNSTQQFMNRRNSSCGSDRVKNHTLLSPLGSYEKTLSDSGLSTSTSSTFPANSSDINNLESRLESLCRQMTEQAIN